MAATADMIMERRRIRRRLAFWRIVAIVAIVVAVISFLPRGVTVGNHIARVAIDGVISSDPARERAIRKLASDDETRAVIVRINSPGGTVGASEAIYEGLRKVAARKPVVVVMDDVAASGGYVAALAGERIFARGNTLTGSIGVIMQAPNVAGLLDKIGVSMTRIKSSPLKAEPSITTPVSQEAIEAQEALIADTYGWFRGLVGERRHLDGAALDRVADGRAFTGRQALKLGLIDAIGGEDAALGWLRQTRGIDRDLKVVDTNWGEGDLPWPLSNVREGTAALARLGRLVEAGPRLYALLQ